MDVLNIKRARIKKRIIQHNAAQQLGIAQNTLSQYEHGTRKVPAALLPKMARLYGCTLEELFGVQKVDDSEQNAR